MKLITRHFGEIDIEEDKLIEFSDGIPGFPTLTKFIILSEQNAQQNLVQGIQNNTDNMICWLQSIEDGSISFVLVDMVNYAPDYNPLVEANEIDGLGKYDPDKFLIYNIAVVPDNVKDMTVNLKAPVVVNSESKQGKQVVCTNDEYSVRHYLFK